MNSLVNCTNLRHYYMAQHCSLKYIKRKDFEYSAKYIKGSFPKVFLNYGQKLSKERYQIIFIDIDTTFIFNSKVRSSFVNSLYESFSIFNCRQL